MSELYFNKFKELEEQISLCARCGMCQSVCPLYNQTSRESDVARGKIAIIDSAIKGNLSPNKSVLTLINNCLLCGACAVNCPNKVSTLEIFLKARTYISSYTGLSLIKKGMLRGILSNYAFFDLLLEWTAKLEHLFIKSQNPILYNRPFPKLSKTPFHKALPLLKNTRRGPKIALFIGCLIDKFFPEIAYSTIKSLTHHDVSIFLPKNQGCCGIPALSLGDITAFNRLVNHNLKLFAEEDFDFLITSCATCTFTIKKIWPIISKDSNSIKLSSKTLDINEFFTLNFNIDNLSYKRDKIKVTYHDPCHLKKSLKIFKEPRKIIEASDGYKLVEMQEPDSCCGQGGSFGLTQYVLSQKIGSKKVQNIKEAGCSTLATSCPACMIQIKNLLNNNNLSHIDIKHPIEIYANSIQK